MIAEHCHSCYISSVLIYLTVTKYGPHLVYISVCVRVCVGRHNSNNMQLCIFSTVFFLETSNKRSTGKQKSVIYITGGAFEQK